MKYLLSILYLSTFFCLTSCGTLKSTSNSEDLPGSSFETAIKVKSIDQEYDYVQENCLGCRVTQQALAFHDDKPFDILTCKTPNGRMIEYYFDISSFFGKGF